MKRGSPGWAPNGKLKPADIIEIRRLAMAVRQADLARGFGVHSRTIYRVVIGETWKSVGQ